MEAATMRTGLELNDAGLQLDSSFFRRPAEPGTNAAHIAQTWGTTGPLPSATRLSRLRRLSQIVVGVVGSSSLDGRGRFPKQAQAWPQELLEPSVCPGRGLALFLAPCLAPAALSGSKNPRKGGARAIWWSFLWVSINSQFLEFIKPLNRLF